MSKKEMTEAGAIECRKYEPSTLPGSEQAMAMAAKHLPEAELARLAVVIERFHRPQTACMCRRAASNGWNVSTTTDLLSTADVEYDISTTLSEDMSEEMIDPTPDCEEMISAAEANGSSSKTAVPNGGYSISPGYNGIDCRCARSMVVQKVAAPPDAVWSVLRQFDKPQLYKTFVRSCTIVEDAGGVGVGSVREVRVVSGLPASFSRERLEILDDGDRVLSFRVVGGEHRLRNYRSVTSVHGVSGENPGACSGVSLVVESYVADVPEGNTAAETVHFVNTLVQCNLQSLARVCQHQRFRVEGQKQLTSSTANHHHHHHPPIVT